MSTSEHSNRVATLSERVDFVHVRSGVVHSEEENSRPFVLRWSPDSVDKADPQAAHGIFMQAAESSDVGRRTSGVYLLLMPRIVTSSTDSFRIEQATRRGTEETWEIQFISRNWLFHPPPRGHHLIIIPVDAVPLDVETLSLSFVCFELGTGLEGDPSELSEEDAVPSPTFTIPQVTLTFE